MSNESKKENGSNLVNLANLSLDELQEEVRRRGTNYILVDRLTLDAEVDAFIRPAIDRSETRMKELDVLYDSMVELFSEFSLGLSLLMDKSEARRRGAERAVALVTSKMVRR